MIQLYTDLKRKCTFKPRFFILLLILIISILVLKYAPIIEIVKNIMPEQLTTSVYWEGVL